MPSIRIFGPHFDIRRPVSLDAARQRRLVEITRDGSDFFTRDFDPWTPEPFNCTPEGVDGPIRK